MTLEPTGQVLLSLIARARAAEDTNYLLSAVCDVLLNSGLPVWRASLGLEFLHPEVSGALTIWVEGSIDERETGRAGVLQSADYTASPTRVVDETQQEFVRTLDAPCPEMPLLEGLRKQGVTSYAMFPLPFLDHSRSANISFATRALGGFSGIELDLLRAVSEVMSPYAERLVLRRIATDLLDTYVGPRTGQRILSGEIERGHVQTIEAAIWFADLRDFVKMSDRLPMEEVLELLDQWFEAMHAKIAANGGEVLKFMGDGALAVFPVDENGNAKAACGRAFAAAADLVAELGSRRMHEAETWGFGIGLHVGSVAYGNIGASRRLDFTVVGPAVNMAARLEQLTKAFDCYVVASEEFAIQCGATMTEGGVVKLKGMESEQRIFVALPRHVAVTGLNNPTSSG
jgi:adenylate cyclase